MKLIRRGPDMALGSWEAAQRWNESGDLTLSDDNLLSFGGWDNQVFTWSKY